MNQQPPGGDISRDSGSSESDPGHPVRSGERAAELDLAADAGSLGARESAADVPRLDEREVARRLAELDLTDPRSVLFFGAKAQEQLTEISDRMLDGVRAKDVGPAGATLSDMVSTLRGFDVAGLDPNRKPGLLSRLLGRGRPIMRFLREYEVVRDQIEGIARDLERHRTSLLTDVTALDRLYAANLDYLRALEGYIRAGERKLDELDEETIPSLARAADASEDVLASQRLRDLRSARDDLERRIHDLKLTRQVSAQALPSIRLVQENDKGLINKIGSTLVNTVPLWRQQLAQAVTIFRSSEAASTVRAATDLTNELLRANADGLKAANAEARRQMERGAFDIETVKHANRSLIETIEESLVIAEEGRRARTAASADLIRLEADLRSALASASAAGRRDSSD